MAPYGMYGGPDGSGVDTFPGDPMTEGEPTIGLRGPAHAAPRAIDAMDWAGQSGGVFDPVNEPMARPMAQGPGTSFLDRFAENLAAGRLTGPNARENDSQTLVHSLLKSTLEGFARQRLKGVDEKQGEQDRLARVSAERNARNVRHAEEARMARIEGLKASSRAEKEARQKQEGWLTVPSHVARAYGDESLTGTKVSPETYDRYLKAYRESLQGDNRITLTGAEASKLGVPDGQRVTVSELSALRREYTDRTKPRGGGGDTEKPLSRREQLSMLAKLDNADARIAAMNRRLESLRGGNAKDPRVASAIMKLEDDLAGVTADREAAVQGLRRAGISVPGEEPTTADTDTVSPPAAASTPALSGRDAEARVAKLRRDAKAAQAELKATGALSAQRRQQAQARLNAIEQEMQALGTSVNQLPNRAGVDLQAPIAAAPKAAASGDAERAIEAARKAGIKDRAALQGWLDEEIAPGVTRRQAFQQRGVIPDLLKQFAR